MMPTIWVLLVNMIKNNNLFNNGNAEHKYYHNVARKIIVSYVLSGSDVPAYHMD
jgi:hypothetical protein